MNKWKGITIGVVVLLVVALITGIYIQNTQYKNYLSDKLANMVSPLVSNISSTEQVLATVIETKILEKGQAARLRSLFSGISTNSKNIIDLGIRIKKLPRNELNDVITTNTKISEYFKKLDTILETGDVIGLSPNQLKEMQDIQSLVSKYTEVARSTVKGVTDSGVNGEFWHHYFKKGVSQKYWVDLMDALEANTPKYTSYLFLK